MKSDRPIVQHQKSNKLPQTQRGKYRVHNWLVSLSGTMESSFPSQDRETWYSQLTISKSQCVSRCLLLEFFFFWTSLVISCKNGNTLLKNCLIAKLFMPIAISLHWFIVQPIRKKILLFYRIWVKVLIKITFKYEITFKEHILIRTV